MDEIFQIVFMRHGRSRADDEEVHEGRYDSPLTEVGRAQAYRRAKLLSSNKMLFDRVIASPLLRAKETAEIIAATLNVKSPVEIDRLWMERDNGALAGLSWKEAAEQCPPPQQRTAYTPHGKTGESDWSLFCRAAEALQDLVRRGPGSYLIVAHGGILNAALSAIFRAPPNSHGWDVSFHFGDCGFAVFSHDPSSQRWRLLGFQSDDYLPVEESTHLS